MKEMKNEEWKGKGKYLITMFILFITFNAQTTKGNVTMGELQALNDLYNTCGGSNWINKTNWMSGDPCANDWYGVYCTSGHVTTLQLTTNGLFGSLPSSLANLYLLETLLLDQNEISGEIPTTLNQIRSLGKIDIHSNYLSSEIPSDLGDLLAYNMEYLDLSNNQLSGAIPSFFDNAPSYFFANLSNNLFTCPIPSWAEYTGANCIQWDITAVDPLCLIPNEDINVYGSNFIPSNGLLCNYYNQTTNQQIGSSPAEVISDSHLICRFDYKFSKCNGDPGFQTFINVILRLTLNNQIITGNQTKEFGLINYSCSFGQSTGYFIIPTLAAVMEFCPYGNPTPYSCPSSLPYYSSSRYIPAVIDATCLNTNYNTTCYWAEPIYSSSTPSCPFYYCSSTTCNFNSYCPGSYSCYSQKSDCISSSACTK